MGDIVLLGRGPTQGLSIFVMGLMESKKEKSISSRPSVSPVPKLQSSPSNGRKLNGSHRVWVLVIGFSLTAKWCSLPEDVEGPFSWAAFVFSLDGPSLTRR
jgi:hypothetical protein